MGVFCEKCDMHFLVAIPRGTGRGHRNAMYVEEIATFSSKMSITEYILKQVAAYLVINHHSAHNLNKCLQWVDPCQRDIYISPYAMATVRLPWKPAKNQIENNDYELLFDEISEFRYFPKFSRVIYKKLSYFMEISINH